MPLCPDDKFGPYTLISPLGEGGMGEVWKARDTRLDRAVAIKFSKEGFNERFKREARAVAALNHPAICTLHDVGTDYIVMEFVDGRPLKGPVPLAEALRLAIQITDALDAAHRKGIVHRDLKPANILVTRTGVKLLDFGLAKFQGAVTTGQETLTTGLTAQGQMLGTLQYMSPEQLKGGHADVRSDIFSFGAVLYELLTGQQAFGAGSSASVIATILLGQPEPIQDLAPTTPAPLIRAISRALEKDPERRWQSIRDLMLELESILKARDQDSRAGPTNQANHERLTWQVPIYVRTLALSLRAKLGIAVPVTQPELVMQATRPTSRASKSASAPSRRSPMKRRLIVALAAAAALIFGTWVMFILSGGRIRFGQQFLSLSPNLQWTDITFTPLTYNGKARSSAISPDGTYVVYGEEDVGKQSLWIRHLAVESSAQIVPSGDVSYAGLAFSHDGRFIYYTAATPGGPGAFYQVPIFGGSLKKIVEPVDGPAVFSPDDTRIAFRRGGDLIVAEADGSRARVIVPKTDSQFIETPAAWSSDGKVLAVGISDFRSSWVSTFDASGGPAVQLGSRYSSHYFQIHDVAWLPNAKSILAAVGMDPSSFSSQLCQISYPEGKARQVTNDLNHYSGISITADGSKLVTVATDLLSHIWIMPSITQSGAREITSGTRTHDGRGGVSFTEDGKVVYTGDFGRGQALWLADPSGAPPRPLPNAAGSRFEAYVPSDDHPAVCAGGQQILYNHAHTQLWRIGLDGSNAKMLVKGNGFNPECSPDGRWVVYTDNMPGHIMRIPIEGGEPTEVSNRRGFYPVISPDGSSVAFIEPMDTLHSRQVVIVSFKGQARSRALPLPGVADGIRWTPDGRALTYIGTRNGVSNLWALPIDGGAPRQVTSFTSGTIFNSAWSRDGHLALARGSESSDVVLIKQSR